MSTNGYFLLSSETEFSAAHTLPGAGTCEQLHGHNWRVRITVRVDEQRIDALGMGIDFHTIDDLAKSSVADFDHAYLNDLEPFKDRPPTAELIAKEVYRRSHALLQEMSRDFTVAEIEVWEMAGYRAVYRPQ